MFYSITIIHEIRREVKFRQMGKNGDRGCKGTTAKMKKLVRGTSFPGPDPVRHFAQNFSQNPAPSCAYCTTGVPLPSPADPGRDPVNMHKKILKKWCKFVQFGYCKMFYNVV